MTDATLPDVDQPASAALVRLHARVAALEQLLEVHERTSLEQSTKLERALQELDELLARERSAHAALAESERRLRLALDTGRMGSWEWDIEHGRVIWSAEEERLYGLEPGTFSGTIEEYRERIHPEDRERSLATLQTALESRAPTHHILHRVVHPDGSVRWLDSHARFIYGDDGRPLRLVGLSTDVTERKAMEEALRYQNYITETITNNATAAMFMMDEQGHCTFMNPAAEAMIGFRLDEIRDFPLHYAIHHHRPDGSLYPMAECPVDRALPENFDVRAHEDIFIRKDGTFFPVLCAASPIFEGNHPVGTVVEVRDVTEDRRRERELREREEQFRTLANSIPQMAWITDATGDADWYNERWYEFTGTTPEMMRGWGWQKVFHPDHVERVTAKFRDAIARGEAWEDTFPIRGRDGEYRWFLSRALPLRDTRGTPARWFGTNTDVTERQEIEAARDRALASAKAERERLYEVFMQAPASIAVLEGPDHVFTVANPLYKELVGRQDVVGQPVVRLFPEIVEQGFIELLDQVRATGEPFSAHEAPVLLDRDGDGVPEQLYVNFVYQPLSDESGQVFGIMAHAVDVTEQVTARRDIERKAEELARLSHALELSNRELDQFAYVASHDLKAPLRGIANLTQWIEEDLGDRVTGESREHMELLKGRVHRMEALIDGILTYSRAGRVRGKLERVDVGRLVGETVELLAPPGHVTITIAEGLPTIETERVPLQQVFMNLIGNAIKYNPRPDARIEITSAQEQECYRFSVADNGPGIPPQYFDRIWQIFQTLSARDKVEGTGIGLSVVRKLVESQGGRAWVESDPGTGATFHFTWPAQPRTT